jgi:DNA polymerase-3 subunit alpha
METFCASRKDLADIAIPDFDDEKVVYEIEKELVGNYVTVDPMSKYLNAIEAICIQHPDDMKNFKLNDLFYVGGIVTKVKRHKTKRGKDMAFIAVSWNEEEFDVVSFPDSWESVKNIIKVGIPVACQVIKLESGCCLSTLERLDFVLK